MQTDPTVGNGLAVGTAAEHPHATLDRRAVLGVLVAVVTVGGTGLAVYGGVNQGQVHWDAILILAVLAVLAEAFDLSLYGDSRVSLAFVPIFGSAVLSGLSGLAVVVPAAVVASSLGRPAYKTAFNFGALMVAGGASVAVLRAFGEDAGPGDWPAIIGPAAVAAVVNFMANSLLVAAAISLETRLRAADVWRENFMWLTPHYVVLGFIGLAMAASYEALGFWGLFVFLAPTVMMRFSQKQYLDQTTKNVIRLRRAHENLQTAHQQVTEAMTSLGRAYEGTLKSLVTALDARDAETAGHSERVADLTMAIAAEMGLQPGTDEWRHISWGALLHDVGKIAIPDGVLRKPSSLNDEEWQAMRTHPGTGHDILQTVDFLQPAAEIVLAHHERWDGGGYPRGLRGEEIPMGARIFMVADAFDAMTSDR
ncbi:MAG TPA: HD-GYP domain-containing protein, partial [Dehalococcoidia bacterium]|nr:HD-GYP domain-containing protein [Dehalococcoidia bacterium]